MKQILLVLIFGLIKINTVFGQCCPYLVEIKVIPPAPTINDNIFLYTNVSTPNLGKYLGYQISEIDTFTLIKACYYSGILTQPQSYTDTINLGKKATGKYKIDFIAYQSNIELTCLITDSNSVLIDFEVTLTTSIDNINNEFHLEYFPNPITGRSLFIESNEIFEVLELKDLFGKILQRRENVKNTTIEIDMNNYNRGIYFIRIIFFNGREKTQKILKL